MSDTFKELAAIFPLSQILWKVGFTSKDKSAGQALPYIDARVVQNRLDEAVGPANWKNSYQEVFMGTQLFSVRCQLSIRIDGEWITKEDAAQLQSGDTDRNTQVKGAYSDALKRAAVQWGIGRYLYEYTPEMVPLDDKGHLSYTPNLPDSFLLPADILVQNNKVVDVPKATPIVAKEEIRPVMVAASEPQRVVQNQDSLQAPRENPITENIPTPSQASFEVTANTDLSSFSANDQAVISELLERLKKHAPATLRSYVTGPKGQANLSEAARKYLLIKIDEKEKGTTTAAIVSAKSAPVSDPKATSSETAVESVKSEAPVAKSQNPADTVQKVPAPSVSTTDDSEITVDRSGLPAGLPADQVSVVQDLLERLKKHSPSILRAYVQGPKGQQKLGEIAQKFLLEKIDAKEKADLGQ